jgi:hypothetical protein
LAADFFFLNFDAASSFFPLAGLGGEGREMEELASGGGSCNGSSSTLVLVRGAEWRLLWSSSISLFLSPAEEARGRRWI